MSFIAQVTIGVISGVLTFVICSVLTTMRLPSGIRAAPWWVWLIALAVAGVVTVALVVRRRRMGTIRVLYYNFWTRRPGEPYRIWSPEKEKKPAPHRAAGWLRSLLRRLTKSRNRTI